MSTSDASLIEIRRARWLRYRSSMSLTENSGDDFALGGLAAYAEPPDVRLCVLPADPLAHVVSLDADTATWLNQPWPSPYGGAALPWGAEKRSTSHALVVATSGGENARWRRYLALHRHGGVEAASAGFSWELNNRGVRVFSLLHAVALVWTALDIQLAAVDRWDIEGPWEVTLALRSCGGAILGGFSEGWLQPGSFGHRQLPCLEPHVLHRWEVDILDPAALADQVAERTENSFGTTHRRHLANRGEFEGRLDPRFTW
jgi:hypothetical protein